MSQHHQTTVHADLFGTDVHVCFISSGQPDNLELQVVEAWLEVPEDKRVITLNAALTRTEYTRPRIVGLPAETFPLIRLGAWDELLDRAQKDRDPMNAAYDNRCVLEDA